MLFPREYLCRGDLSPEKQNIKKLVPSKLLEIANIHINAIKSSIKMQKTYYLRINRHAYTLFMYKEELHISHRTQDFR